MHNIEMYDISVNGNTKALLNEIDEHVYHETYAETGGRGLEPITWHDDKIYANREDAKEAIRRLDKGWYNQLAVKYYDPVEVKYTKKCDELKQRLVARKAELFDLDSKIHYEGVKSGFVSCRGCGSKINSKYFGSGKVGNRCPICKADLRPESLLDRIEAKETAIKKLELELSAERKKCEAKAKKKVMWLIKIEYHT